MSVALIKALNFRIITLLLKEHIVSFGFKECFYLSFIIIVAPTFLEQREIETTPIRD